MCVCVCTVGVARFKTIGTIRACAACRMAASSSSWARRLSSWEQRAYAPAAEPPAGGDVVEDDDDGDETDVESLSPEACSEEFLNMLVKLKLRGDISATSACGLAFWAKGAGLIGRGADLALNPNRTGGHFSEHFDKVIGLDIAEEGDRHMCQLAVPGHERCTLGRTVIQTAASLAHHLLAEEVASTPSLTTAPAASEHSWGGDLHGAPAGEKQTRRLRDPPRPLPGRRGLSEAGFNVGVLADQPRDWEAFSAPLPAEAAALPLWVQGVVQPFGGVQLRCLAG